MITNITVTLWRQGYDKASRMDVWERQVFPEASLQRDCKVQVKDGKLEGADAVRLRIPTDRNISIACGDKVSLGSCPGPEPPPDALTVIGFADNRKGSRRMWHWKVVCT